MWDAVLFLRFCYRPRDLTPANMAAVQSSLPVLLRLAHKLDVADICAEVGKHMAGTRLSLAGRRPAAPACLRPPAVKAAPLWLTAAVTPTQRLVQKPRRPQLLPTWLGGLMPPSSAS